MSVSATYCPVLKDKQAELGALAELAPESRSATIPMIEVRPGGDLSRPAVDQVRDRLANASTGLMGCWGVADPVRVDLRYLRTPEYGEGDYDAIFDWCREIGLQVVPVTGRDCSDAIRRAAARAVRRGGLGGCIRVVGDDLGIGMTGLGSLLKELDSPREMLDLVLDAGQLPQANLFWMSSLLQKACTDFNVGSGWRSGAFCGASFPVVLSETVENNAFARISRSEWTLWSRLRRAADANSDLSFGDYGVVNPDVQSGGRGAANIRYTQEATWYVARGNPPDTAPQGEYQRLTRELMNSAIWIGAEHCPGCQFKAKRLDDLVHPGNATQWRQSDFAHHFAVVTDTLATDACG